MYFIHKRNLHKLKLNELGVFSEINNFGNNTVVDSVTTIACFYNLV